MPAMAKLGKLLALLALLLTSFSMTAAPAAAAAHHPPAAAAAMPMEHCPDEGGKADGKGVPACAMACSAALPAADLPQQQLPLIVCAPVGGPVARSLHGLHPDTATPPPKGS